MEKKIHNELLEKDNSVSIHHKNVEVLATEMYKISNNMSPKILKGILIPKATTYNQGKPIIFKMGKA